MTESEKIVTALLDATVINKEIPPPRWHHDEDEADIADSSRYPFNAWEHALRIGKHHPKLWGAIKNSPYERQYRSRFNPPD